MTNHLALIEKTQSLIAAGDIVGAEAALVALADDEGDAALMVVLEQLPPKDVLAVIREYDNSKESVVGLLVTPAQFARAVVIEKLYKDLTRTHLRGMVNAVIFREDADPVEFLTAIGDLEGGSKGQMLASGTGKDGSGAYVALELISGTLNGRRGSFVLQHNGTMTKGVPNLIVTVVPDSGTDELTGLAGTMTIVIAEGKHSYIFAYTLDGGVTKR